MAIAKTEPRSIDRKLKDEQIAAEPPMAPPALSASERALPMEEHLKRLRKRPVAILGIVENGLVRPLDPHVKLPDHAHVIIVASEPV